MSFVENHAFHLNNSLNGSVLRDDLEVRLPTYHESHPAKVSNQYHGVQHVRFIFIFTPHASVFPVSRNYGGHPAGLRHPGSLPGDSVGVA